MSKFIEPHEETQNLYNQAIDNVGLGNFINITILVNDRLKTVFKLKKADEILQHRAGDDVIVIINEKIIDQLTPAQRVIVIEESLASISFDTEKNLMVITPPDFLAHSGIIRKHTFNTIEVLRESIKTLYAAEKQEEDERKAATAKAKKDKQSKKK